MRKTKDIKRKKELAGQAFKRGERTEAYKMWTEAKKELDELKAKKMKKKAPAAETPAS